jgi:ubiquinone/menaquinone biosynthesis C-methylase UbiE
MEKYYPESAQYVSDPQQFYKRIAEQTNYLDAIKLVDWNKYLEKDATILDLGGGIGWLSAFLSRFENVSKIYLLDSSRHFLQNMVPSIVSIMSGKIDKIVTIEALFSPLFFEEKSLDMVVICSTLHHADNIASLLLEIKRVLKDDGVLLILNETPASYLSYAFSMVKQFLKIITNTLACRYKSVSPTISSSGFLYDPRLYDKSYPLWYWKKAIDSAGFSSVSVIDTGLATVKDDKNGVSLKHFICMK